MQPARQLVDLRHVCSDVASPRKTELLTQMEPPEVVLLERVVLRVLPFQKSVLGTEDLPDLGELSRGQKLEYLTRNFDQLRT